jgi:hypothetical protein
MQFIFIAILAALAATGSVGDVVEDKEKLTFKADGTFKILHLSDVHYKVIVDGPMYRGMSCNYAARSRLHTFTNPNPTPLPSPCKPRSLTTSAEMCRAMSSMRARVGQRRPSAS